MTLPYQPWRATSGLLTRNWFKPLFSQTLLQAAAHKSYIQDVYHWDPVQILS